MATPSSLNPHHKTGSRGLVGNSSTASKAGEDVIKSVWATHVPTITASTVTRQKQSAAVAPKAVQTRRETLPSTLGIVGGALGAGMGAVTGGAVGGVNIATGSVAATPFLVPAIMVGIQSGTQLGYDTGYVIGKTINTIRSKL